MQLTEVRINLCSQRGSRLKAFCSLTFDDTFVVRDVKLIDGNDGLFLAMPSRKLADHCPNCNDKNHLRARYCNNCGRRLNEDRYQQYRNGNGHQRVKLHADIAHPINAGCRTEIERRVLQEFDREVQRSQEPGYVPPSLEGEDFDSFDVPQRFDVLPRPLRAHPGHGATGPGETVPSNHARVASSPMA